ncbi:MAG: FHA domain-containing protein [Anaerolineaceae bacterium]|nr:FHA domain-containing protein [Anaerolineaceae bacterium]
MSEVVCTVIFNNDQKRDLILPDNVQADQLANVIALALKLPKDRDTYYELKVPEGKTLRRLPDSKTLQHSFILNGSFLYLTQEKEDPNNRAFFEGGGGLKMRIRENTVIGRLTPKEYVDIDLTALDKEKVVSRRHAAITHVSYHYVIKDLESHNGTYINEIRLKRGESVVLHPGDEVCFGSLEKGVRLTFTA